MREPYPYFIASKLAKLTEHAQALQSWSQQAVSESKAHQDNLGELRYSLAALERHAVLPVSEEASTPQGVDPERLQHLKTEATKLEAAIEAATAEYKRRHELYGIAQHSVNVTRDWLAKLPEGTPLSPAPPVKIENGDHRKVLDVVRRELAETQARLKALKAAPLPFEDLSRIIEAWVAGRAQAQNVVVHAGSGAFQVVWTKARKPPFDPGTPDPVSLLCRLFPQGMHALLLEGAGAAPGMDGALSDLERAEKLADLSAKGTALEMQEEALVQALLDAGNSLISRRRDASPAVLLGAVVGTPAARTAEKAAA